MTDLYPLDAPDGVQVLIEHLKHMAAPGCVRSEKPSNSPLPFIEVFRTGGGDDGIVDKGHYGVFVFGEDQVATKNLANQVKARIRLLAPGFGGQYPVTLSTGKVYVDKVRVEEGPRPVSYVEDSVPRSMYMYSAIYEVWLRINLAI